MNERAERTGPPMMQTILLVFCVGAAASMLTPLGFSLRSILCASAAAIVGSAIILVFFHSVRGLRHVRGKIFWRSRARALGRR